MQIVSLFKQIVMLLWLIVWCFSLETSDVLCFSVGPHSNNHMPPSTFSVWCLRRVCYVCVSVFPCAVCKWMQSFICMMYVGCQSHVMLPRDIHVCFDRTYCPALTLVVLTWWNCIRDTVYYVVESSELSAVDINTVCTDRSTVEPTAILWLQCYKPYWELHSQCLHVCNNVNISNTVSICQQLH